MRNGAAFVLLCGALAQSMAAQTAPSGAAAPTIRTTASEVMLDIVVRDKHGKPVRNVKPAEVEIYEDGVRREIRSFRYAGAREAETRAAGTAAANAGRTAAPRPLRAVNIACIVLHNIDPTLRPRAIEAVQEFLKNDLEPDTYAGLFLLDDALTPVYAFTNHRRELAVAMADAFRLRPLDFDAASIAVLTANPTQVMIDTVTDTVAHTSATTMRIAGGEIAKTVITGADVNTAAGASIQRGARVAESRDFAEITGMRATDQILTMIGQFARLPGRKSVLLVSGGLLTSGDPDRFDKVLARARDGGLTIYAMDVAGLSHESTAQAADIALARVAGVSRSQTAIGGSLSEAKEKSRQGDTMNQAVRASDPEAALRALAEGTGGFLIANTNDFRKPFQRIVDDLDAHYEASYQPTSSKDDGKLRRIEIKMARPDLHADSRAGYFALPPGEPLQPFEVFGLAAINAPRPPRAFPFHVAAFDFRGGRETLVFQLPGASLTATPVPPGVQRMHASLYAVVRNAAGEVVDQYSLDAPYQAPDANLKAIQSAAFTYTHAVTLSTGRYSVETAVIDREGGRASVVSQSFDIPEAGAGLAMSAPMLVRSIEEAGPNPDPADPLILKSKRLIPMAGAALAAGENPYVYFVVYPPPGGARPKLQIEFRVNGAVVANQASDLPAPDASGAIAMMIRAAKHPGECELRITATGDGPSVTRSIRYTVAE